MTGISFIPWLVCACLLLLLHKKLDISIKLKLGRRYVEESGEWSEEHFTDDYKEAVGLIQWSRQKKTQRAVPALNTEKSDPTDSDIANYESKMMLERKSRKKLEEVSHISRF
ncbi:hypothetical protein RIF29_14168 [Crotalaria pallida]|uniref:Uncharacterized protein n=1 Tax=Crotalaria pallida TaxID=3830 RepID=A0AAN9FAZ3_CROPI